MNPEGYLSKARQGPHRQLLTEGQNNSLTLDLELVGSGKTMTIFSEH